MKKDEDLKLQAKEIAKLKGKLKENGASLRIERDREEEVKLMENFSPKQFMISSLQLFVDPEIFKGISIGNVMKNLIQSSPRNDSLAIRAYKTLSDGRQIDKGS
ncbi:hypothetical protein QVD17_37974 [Tagetes erecta]|uniref:Uncharacterized protein n=1 Tax=Tagetes erecta TaxID=13708 RepID=A0AAD8JV03_TARER|nr:hypothetical protein QVD17_37974 [Tagetes erecta]